MTEVLGSWKVWLTALVVVGGSTCLAVAGMLLVRKRVPMDTLISYHEVAGYLLSVIGTLYAVLLGFVVVDAMNGMQDARLAVEEEANAIANVFMCAEALKQKDRDSIQVLCEKYVHQVIDEEWQAMDRGGFCRSAFDTSWLLWKDIIHVKPEGDAEVSVHQNMISEMSRMGDHRRVRLLRSTHGVAPIMWVVLIVGGVFTVVFTYFFAVKSVKVQILMTLLVTVTLALNLLLVVLFGTPFRGVMAVRPEAFQLDLKIFNSFITDCRAQGDHHPDSLP